MTMEEFRRELLEGVRASAESYADTYLARFVEDIGVRLTDAEELSDFEPCHFEGEGTRKRKLLVDGYAFDDADESLSLVVALFDGDDKCPSVGLTEIKRQFGMLRAFVEEAISGRLTDGGALSIEESEHGYGLARDLELRHRSTERYRLYLVTDSELAMRTKDLPEEEIDGVVAEFHVWDIARFYRAHESATGRDDLDVDLSAIHGGLPFLRAGGAEGEYEAYLCMIPGAVLADIYERYGSRLLEGNIRSFLSLKGDVNRKIRGTILNNPEMFFAYNNGISATAEDVTIVGAPGRERIASARNLQIVNGGQTTASIATARRKDKADLTDVYVQMKLSVLPPERAAQLIPDIARHANSQNKVNEADFFANHPYHIRIEEFSRRLWAPAVRGAQHGTRWFYERARGQYLNEQARMSRAEKSKFLLQHPRTQLLTKTDVAKLENTWRALPHKVSQGSQKNFREFAEWVAGQWDRDSSQFHEEYFRHLVALAVLFRFAERFVAEQPWYQAGGYRANLVTYSLAKLKVMIDEQGRGAKLDLRQIWERQAPSEEVAQQLGAISKAVADVLTASDRLKENVTEWAKMPACWTRVQELQIPLNQNLAPRLLAVRDEAEVNRGAKKRQVEDDAIAAQITVVGIPGSRWQQIRAWASAKGLLTPREASFLNAAVGLPARVPSEKQCEQIWEIAQRLAQEGCPHLPQ